jgi:hypothetical protein
MSEPRRDQEFAWECEHRYMLPYREENIRLLPEAARRVVEQNAAEGYPTGVGRHPDHGWFVLSSGGQGPCFEWTEW